MVDSLRVILEQKIMVPVSDRPVGMQNAGWCWRVEGGFISVWSDMRGAINWDGETLEGRVSYDTQSKSWVVRLPYNVASDADVYHTYGLDGMEC